LGVPVLNDRDRILAVLVVAHTEPWVLQRYQPVLEALAKLAAIAIQRNDDLKKLKADEQISMLAQLAAGKLHSFRNSVSFSIGCVADQLQKAPGIPEDVRGDICAISKAATEIANGMKNLMRIWAEQSRARIDLRQIIENALERVVIPRTITVQRRDLL
jgi:hypothetical protein